MILMQQATRSLISFRAALGLRALAHRLFVSRPADDSEGATFLSTRKWSDQTERGLHSALARRQQQRHRW
jgi:hypothetical protein